MNSPGAIATRAAADAVSPEALSVREEGANSGKWVEAILANVGLAAGAPWCAAWVYTRLMKAAGELGLQWPQNGYPRSGYCPDVQNWAKKHGCWIPVELVRTGAAEIARGDLALFYFAAKGRVAHIGIVVDVGLGGALFQTVEGNTSSEGGVNRDGDGVYVKHRSCASLGSGGGFIRLEW